METKIFVLFDFFWGCNRKKKLFSVVTSIHFFFYGTTNGNEPIKFHVMECSFAKLLPLYLYAYSLQYQSIIVLCTIFELRTLVIYGFLINIPLSTNQKKKTIPKGMTWNIYKYIYER